MIRFHLFRALNPIDRYPASPIDLTFDGVRYDLVLPTRVGIAFARLLSADGPFRRLENYSVRIDLSDRRSIPYPFELDHKVAVYAESELQVESSKQGGLVGYIVQQAAANAAAAHHILQSVIQVPSLPLDVIDWMFGHAPFMDYCGGFEVAHICCYSSAEERETALDAAAGAFDDAEPNLYRPHVTHLSIN